MYGYAKPPAASGLNRYTVFKRVGNVTIKLGIVSASNKVQADTRARFMFAKLLGPDEAVWAEEETE